MTNLRKTSLIDSKDTIECLFAAKIFHIWVNTLGGRLKGEYADLASTESEDLSLDLRQGYWRAGPTATPLKRCPDDNRFGG